MGQDIVEQLKDRERRIRSIQADQSRLSGKQEQLVATLEKEFKVNSITEGNKVLKRCEDELSAVDTQLTDLVRSMDEEMAKARG